MNPIKKEFAACWQFASLRLGFVVSVIIGFIVALPELWLTMPPELKAMFPEEYTSLIALVVFTIAGVNRIAKQKAVVYEKQEIERDSGSVVRGDSMRDSPDV